MSTPVNASARTRLSRVERRRQPSATAPAVASLFAAYSFRTRGSSTSSSSSSYSEPTKEITLDHPDLPGNPWTAPPDADLSVLSLSMNARLSSQALLHGNPHTIRPTLRQGIRRRRPISHDQVPAQRSQTSPLATLEPPYRAIDPTL